MRSGDRKSGNDREKSASSTPTKVTSGKSCPLAIICVPTRMSTSPRCMPERTSAYAPRFRVTSESSRSTRASFHRFETQERSRSVPIPTCASLCPPHFAHDSGSLRITLQ